VLNGKEQERGGKSGQGERERRKTEKKTLEDSTVSTATTY
jgi:hypothetical protein